jgi:hypothetical protein
MSNVGTTSLFSTFYIKYHWVTSTFFIADFISQVLFAAIFRASCLLSRRYVLLKWLGNYNTLYRTGTL